MKAFAVLAGILVVLVLLIASYTAITGRDGPGPDLTGLVCARNEVAPDENAYPLFIAAAEALAWPDEARFVSDFLAGRADADGRLVSLFEDNRQALALVARGAKMERCVGPTVTAPEDLSMPVSAWMSLGRLLAARSRQERLAGRDAPAVEACADLLSFGYLLQSEANVLLTYLVGQALLQTGLEQARDLARDAATARPELDRLAGVLDRIGDLDAGLIRAIQADYAFGAAMIDQVRDLGASENGLIDCAAIPRLFRGRRGVGYFFQPNRTKRLLAGRYREMIDNVPRPYCEMTCTDVEAALGLDGAKWRILARPNAMGKVLVSTMAPGFDDTLSHRCKIEAALAAMRVTVALRRYRLDSGALPPDLQALVPAYLAAVPSDPFDGRPFRYLPEREVVYAVGEDGIDAGGSSQPAGTRVRPEDLVFDFGVRPSQ